MKRLIPIFLAAALFCGCGTADVTETADPSETEATLAAVDPTEPGGSYDPDSAIEKATAGAVRAYPLSIAGAYAMTCVGSDVLLFSGTGTTTIIKLTGDNLYVTAAAQIDCRIHPEDTSVTVTEKGVSYFDGNAKEMVLLDTNLKEISRISLPEDLVGTPVMTADRKNIYYCTADSIRVLTLDNGISRMLKEITYESQTVEAVLLDGAVLQVRLGDGISEKYLFLSTDTGRTLREYSGSLTVKTVSDRWYATVSEGILNAFLYGQGEESPMMLTPRDYTSQGIILETLNRAVTVTHIDGGLQLDVYDLETGMRTAALALEGCSDIESMEVNAAGEICVLGKTDSGSLILYRWDTAGTPADDSAFYSGSRYTLEEPDADGLAACEVLATDMESRYGVDISFYTVATAVEPWNYNLTAEFHPTVLMDALTALDEALSVYPQGMLSMVMSGISEDPIHICIVREITGSPESGNLETVPGIQFWQGSSNYVVIRAGCDMPDVLYRQMYYAMENYLMSNSNDLYDWEYLNPSGFDYDYDYTTYLTREDTTYLEGEKRYFIDAYSMTFPREDRAAIMQYAMIPGNEELFAGSRMQAKLKALCKTIREACGLTKSRDTFLWEQYLAKSLAYSK